MSNDKQRGLNSRERYVRYHVETMEAPAPISLPPKFTVKRFNNCMDAGECAQVCIYEAHKMKENKILPPIEDRCRGCFLCYLRCPENAISLQFNPEYEKLGDSYFDPERIETIYFEAETGRVPVSGTGYKGPFAGKGFDGIWFDFSEIVRPTRDGIHGREYISTSVDLGKKLPYLQFNKNGELLSTNHRNIETPIPIFLDAPLACRNSNNLLLSLAKAATKLETFAIINAKEYSSNLLPYKSNLIPRIAVGELDRYTDLIQISRILEVDFEEGTDAKELVEEIRGRNPSALISFRFPYDAHSHDQVEDLAKNGIDIAHCYLRDELVQKDQDEVKAIQRVHSHLVDRDMRNSITLIHAGGIAEAAHVPKSMILGADVVSVGLAYQIALGCRVCYGDRHAADCRIEFGAEKTELATQRIINLIGSWRGQLLEVLGGMGLREVRRQRGEIGRAIFYEDLEKRIFGDEE
ncbi:MAG: glutamate synthase-related protein [Candidatus Bathyarchaeia archaeon]